MTLPPPLARTIEPQRAPALVRPRLDHVLVALPLLELALVVFGQLPALIVNPLRESQPAEILKPLDLLLGPDARRLGVRVEVLVADDAVLVGLALERPVDLGPLLAPDHPLARLQHLGLKPRPELPRRELLTSRPDAFTQIVAVDLKRTPVLPDAANQQMDVRVVGVVMVDRDPFELRSEVLFHSAHQLAHVIAKIQPIRVLGRDDDAPHQLVAAALPRSHRRHQVDPLARRVEAEPLLELPLRARTREVLRVRDPRPALAVA